MHCDVCAAEFIGFRLRTYFGAPKLDHSAASTIILYICVCSIGSPSRIRRHFCSHSVDRNKLMPIMANHSNPEMDGRRIERYSKTSRRNFDHLLKGERAYYYGKTYLPLSTTFRRPKSAVSAVSKGFSRTVLSRFLIFQRKTPT